jgi:hypothetical protein
MSQMFAGILGAVAVSLTFGAVQFASGSDLVTTGRDVSQADVSQANDDGVNRAAKADRANLSKTSIGQSETIAVRLDGVSDTSVLVRLPAKLREEARNRSPGAAKEPVSPRKTTVACEPVVSVLTEVAKLLQPGRCVT